MTTAFINELSADKVYLKDCSWESILSLLLADTFSSQRIVYETGWCQYVNRPKNKADNSKFRKIQMHVEIWYLIRVCLLIYLKYVENGGFFLSKSLEIAICLYANIYTYKHN